MRTILDSLGSPVSSQDPPMREAERSEMEEAVLLAVMMEEGDTKQGYGTSRSWKRPEVFLRVSGRISPD